ncbi:MAG: hypothetical protein IT230_14175 [Flavobacteriales bacterium]|nr:hypothetical protein [Flavobacteriales bacterium]
MSNEEPVRAVAEVSVLRTTILVMLFLGLLVSIIVFSGQGAADAGASVDASPAELSAPLP